MRYISDIYVRVNWLWGDCYAGRSFIEQKVEESVDELFVAGKASDPLLVDQKGSLWDLIRNNLGNRFESKLCNLIRIVEQE